jgi:hypothetical protein
VQPDVPDEEHEQPGRRKGSDQKEDDTEHQAFDHDASTRRIYLLAALPVRMLIMR